MTMTRNSTTYKSRIQEVTLVNGFKAYLMPILGCKTISLKLSLIDVFVSLKDDPMVETTATMTGEMLLKGSGNFSHETLAQDLDDMCLSGIRFSGSSDSLKLGATIVSSDLPKLLEIIYDALANPSFDENQLAILKNQYMGYVLSQKSDTGALAGIALMQRLYPKSSRYYVSDPDYDVNCLKQLNESHMRQYLKRMVNGHKSYIVMVGDFDVEKVTSVLNDSVGKLPVPGHFMTCYQQTSDKDKFIADSGGSTVNTQVNGKSSTDIKIAFPLDFDRKDKDFEACLVASNILGGDTLTSRLGKEVREKQGLTYGITASFKDTKFLYSPLTIEITVNPKNVDKALKSIDEVMRDFLANGVTQSELNAEVMSLINGISISRRTNMAVCQAISRCLEQGLDLSELDSSKDVLAKLTVSDVNEAIKRHFKPAYDKFKVISIAGS